MRSKSPNRSEAHTFVSATVVASARWREIDPRNFLSRAAESIGIGSSTDQGWAPQIPSSVPPIGMAGGLPDPGIQMVADLLPGPLAEADVDQQDPWGRTTRISSVRTSRQAGIRWST